MIQYRREVLDDAQNNLGRLAVGLGAAFNEVHQQGYDLHGSEGGEFFTVSEPRVIPADRNTAGALPKVSIDNAAHLTADDYRVNVNADGNFVVTNVSTDQVFDPIAPGSATVIEGVRFDFDGVTAGTNDSWLIQPTRNAAGSISVNITDPAKIAAAAEGTGESNGDIALQLAQLQYEKTLGGSEGSANKGSMSLTEAFSQIVNRVGVLSQQNKTAGKAQESLIQQTCAAQQQVSGVNLNEEYVNLEQYMEQFRAASRLIDVSSNLFDTLLNMR